MMLTRCPSCTTTFRVTPEQVKARHGQVRCGRCQHVFDAIEFLVDAATVNTAISSARHGEPERVVEETAPATIDVSTASLLVADATPNESAEATELPPDEPADTSVAEEIAHEEAEVVPASEDEQTPDDPPSVSESSQILLQTPQPSPLSAGYLRATEAARTPRWPWWLGVGFTLIALILQATLHYRTDLATKYPAARPWLEELCAHAHCVVELPSNPDLVSIEASDLHPGRKGELELTATLKNRADYTQAWPHLELTLTDGIDKPIVRKIITPNEYLPQPGLEATGFAANSDQSVQLALDPGTLPAAGYRLYLFYP